MKIKVCGLTDVKEAEYINENNIDFAGMVLFFPKSKRNISIEKAKEIMAKLNHSVKKVAVVVSPTKEQVTKINSAGFDYIQIHGDILDDVLETVTLPILKAFNVSDMKEFEKYNSNDKVCGFVFDAPNVGSGKTFDWNILSDIPRSEKLFVLAGGLNPENVSEAVHKVKPDVVDVSSGVENDNGIGKSKDKIKAFANNTLT